MTSLDGESYWHDARLRAAELQRARGVLVAVQAPDGPSLYDSNAEPQLHHAATTADGAVDLLLRAVDNLELARAQHAQAVIEPSTLRIVSNGEDDVEPLRFAPGVGVPATTLLGSAAEHVAAGRVAFYMRDQDPHKEFGASDSRHHVRGLHLSHGPRFAMSYIAYVLIGDHIYRLVGYSSVSGRLWRQAATDYAYFMTRLAAGSRLQEYCSPLLRVLREPPRETWRPYPEAAPASARPPPLSCTRATDGASTNSASNSASTSDVTCSACSATEMSAKRSQTSPCKSSPSSTSSAKSARQDCGGPVDARAESELSAANTVAITQPMLVEESPVVPTRGLPAHPRAAQALRVEDQPTAAQAPELVGAAAAFKVGASWGALLAKGLKPGGGEVRAYRWQDMKGLKGDKLHALMCSYFTKNEATEAAEMLYKHGFHDAARWLASEESALLRPGIGRNFDMFVTFGPAVALPSEFMPRMRPAPTRPPHSHPCVPLPQPQALTAACLPPPQSTRPPPNEPAEDRAPSTYGR